MRTIPLERFHYDPALRLLSADISELGPHPFYSVYSDATDHGITILSHHTGEAVTFAITRLERDGEGDLVMWELTPIAQSIRDYPHVAGLRVHLYND